MSRNSMLVLFAALALFAPATAFAQLVPPAGSAGAGNSAISGVPFGPANPSVLSDPSGIGNASRIPPLAPNPPGTADFLWCGRYAVAAGARGDGALCRRLAADHQPASGAAAKAAGSEAWPPGDEFVHGDLPGVLARPRCTIQSG